MTPKQRLKICIIWTGIIIDFSNNTYSIVGK